MNFSSTELSFDLAKAQNYFHSNPSRNFIQMGSFKNDGTPLVFKIVGRATSDKIYASSFEGKVNYSLPMEIEELAATKKAFELFAEKVSAIVPEWDVNDPLARENFWLRLAFDHRTKKFKTTTNLNLTPKNVEKVTGLNGKEIVASVEVKAWFNLKDEKAGVSLNVLDVTFN